MIVFWVVSVLLRMLCLGVVVLVCLVLFESVFNGDGIVDFFVEELEEL